MKDSVNWLLLSYKMPSEPSRNRLSVWRKLKSLGGVYLQNGVCILPRTDEFIRSLKILENEISEANGEAVLLQTVAFDQHQEDKVVARFKADRDEEYREFIDKCTDFIAEINKETQANHFTYAELEENDVDLKKLQNWLNKIRKLDYYQAELSITAQASLAECEQMLDGYALKVFEAHEENH